jgi:hypothetical protein
MSKLESLKQQLNALYGRSAYELKHPMYIDNRKSKMMEDFKMSTNMNAVDAFTYTIQQDIYKALASSPTVTLKTESTKSPEEDTWVWVTGYKGLDKDMKAHGDFQYEMGKQYVMNDGEDVRACHSGFHMCMNLTDVYNYRDIGSGNRYFECKALVRESDLKEYGKPNGNWIMDGIFMSTSMVDKLAGKAIELTRELTTDEILAHVEGIEEWSESVKEVAINKCLNEAKKEIKVITMTKMGYVEPLARYIINHCDGSGYDLAVALDAQTDISMDTKVNAIFSHI